MGPHETLGVPRDCTRAEAKEAFRARARSAHPDRGGDIPTFIRLRRAYEEIMAELDRMPAAAEPKAPRPTPSVRPARPPDPEWDADFFLLDDPPRRDLPPRPPDPDWDAELILFDDDPHGEERSAPDLESAGRVYRTWLKGVTDASHGRERMQESRSLSLIGLAAVLLVLSLLCALFW